VSNYYSPPLQVVQFIGTRRGDPERGPLVRMRAEEAARRLLVDGELVWVYGPRRQELATLVVDDTVPRGSVVVRDIAGVAPAEVVRVVKPDLDAGLRRPGSYA
jgi:anaerobic selenocysteine-containing dehydrogenase